MSQPIYLNDLGLVCALGDSIDAVTRALFRRDAPSGVAPTDRYSPGRSLHLGAVAGITAPVSSVPITQASRNNALLAKALEPLRESLAQWRERIPASRIAVILASSTSGIAETEAAMAHFEENGVFPAHFHLGQQELSSAAEFVALQVGAAGPAVVISSACSSSAKALASAARWLRSGICDLVIAGGADSLCGFTVAGFSALESVSAERCNPHSLNRCGINIGEGAALFLVSREPGTVQLSGWGESSDAHHISAPEPQGLGAEAAMRAALDVAHLHATQIDYVNLHGTATAQNDSAESHAVHRIFGVQPWCSSTKPLTGHALGAAGAIEAALCWIALQPGNTVGDLPPHWWDGAVDPQLSKLKIAEPGTQLKHRPRHILSNSFAFGGNNASLILSAALGAPAVSQIPIGELIKHTPPMVLIDKVLDAGEEFLVAEVLISQDSPFFVNGEVGAWVGIEYMAQSIAAWSGWRARERGEPIKIGYLLGTRRYDTHVSAFPLGTRLQVRVEREFQADNGLARFKAEIWRGEDCWAQASVSVFEPPHDSATPETA